LAVLKALNIGLYMLGCLGWFHHSLKILVVDLAPLPNHHPTPAMHVLLPGNMLKNCLVLVALPAAVLLPT
jgi:hypothetical protein